MLLDDSILNTINPLPHDVYDYTHLKVIDFIKSTNKAVNMWIEQYNYNGSDGYSGWIPKSVLRVDRNNELWIQNWFKEKERF